MATIDLEKGVNFPHPNPKAMERSERLSREQRSCNAAPESRSRENNYSWPLFDPHQSRLQGSHWPALHFEPQPAYNPNSGPIMTASTIFHSDAGSLTILHASGCETNCAGYLPIMATSGRMRLDFSYSTASTGRRLVSWLGCLSRS